MKHEYLAEESALVCVQPFSYNAHAIMQATITYLPYISSVLIIYNLLLYIVVCNA